MLTRFAAVAGTDLRQHQKTLPVAEVAITDESIWDFVSKDTFGIGITMAQLAQNLDLRINFQCDALIKKDNSSGSRVHKDENAFFPSQVSESQLAQIEQGVSALLAMPFSSRLMTHDGHSKRIHSRPRIIVLVIRQEDGVWIAGNLEECLKRIGRAYHGLRSKGFTMIVQYLSEEIGFNVSVEEDAWSWTHAGWETKLWEKNSSKVGPQDGFGEQQAKVWNGIRTYLFYSITQ